MDQTVKCCILIPIKDRPAVLRECLASVLPQLSERVHLLLVDDGSEEDVFAFPGLAGVLERPGVHLVRHSRNLGVAAARNTGISWCLERGYDITVMIDSDCLAPAGHVATHLAMHQRHPDPAAAVVAGAIRGVGGTLWARLDGMMTWFHVLPGTPERVIAPPYSAPTANISVKNRTLGSGDGIFDTRLRTGEDTAFSRRVRAAGHHIWFSPAAEVAHYDRTTFGAMLRHQLSFGRHHYYLGHVDFGLGGLCFRPWYRVAFVPAFVFVLPLYAVAGCLLNVWPLLQQNRRNALYWPLIQAVWLLKGFAVLQAAILTRRAFRLA